MTENISKESTKLTLVSEVLKPHHVDVLYNIFEDINISHADDFFFPHEFTKEKANEICNYNGKDLYVIGSCDGEPAAYGMLRGWDEGYDIPSLGIYVCYYFRGFGIGHLFMNDLHSLARSSGAYKVRLTVLKNNDRAINLYNRIGYKFEDGEKLNLVGTFSLDGT